MLTHFKLFEWVEHDGEALHVEKNDTPYREKACDVGYIDSAFADKLTGVHKIDLEEAKRDYLE